MIYLAGNNNLTAECMFALTEMKRASLSNDLNVMAQFDPSDPYLSSHRYEINPDSEMFTRTSSTARAITKTSRKQDLKTEPEGGSRETS